jgi:hypothetical protein
VPCAQKDGRGGGAIDVTEPQPLVIDERREDYVAHVMGLYLELSAEDKLFVWQRMMAQKAQNDAKAADAAARVEAERRKAERAKEREELKVKKARSTTLLTERAPSFKVNLDLV